MAFLILFEVECDERKETGEVEGSSGRRRRRGGGKRRR